MKKIIIAIGMALPCLSHADDASDLQALAALLQALQAGQSPAQQTQPIYYYPDPTSQIYQAYPNNPEMWRYLQRNPRYIPLYLGQ